MAGRDINIPFGPDRTGALDLSSIIPEITPSEAEGGTGGETGQSLEPATNIDEAYERAFADMKLEPVAEPVPEDAAAAGERPGHTDRFAPVSDEPAPSAVAADETVEVAAELDDDAAAAEANVDGEADLDSEDEQANAAGGAVADVQASLVALKDSIDQGRKLKAREKERDEFGQKLDMDREELADREDILANYHSLVAEQDAIVDQNSQQREARKAELAQIMADQEQINGELQRLRDYNDAQLEPLETALGRAKATAEQAKNDERSRKAELNAAETEKRRAEGGDDSAMTAARFEVAQQAYEDAAARSRTAKEELDKAQKRYDEVREQAEQAEAPLERSLEDLEKQVEELKESVNRLGDVISSARKRRQYCDTVYQYPDETAKLRASVEADEETVRRMDAENEELRDLLAESKERSKIAKFVIAGVIALIIVIIVVVVFVMGR